MDRQQGPLSHRHSDGQVQFIPAEKGWLALFEDVTEDGLRIHADPVVAWRLTDGDRSDPQAPHTSMHAGQAVVGASPWLEKADSEHSAHFFALVREEQLDADFLAELTSHSKRSREEIVDRARHNHAARSEGHASWRRQRRGERNTKTSAAHFGLFAL